MYNAQTQDNAPDEVIDLSEIDEKVRALMQELGIDDPDEIKEEKQANLYCYAREEYLVMTDGEADHMWDEYLESFIDEVILPEMPEHLQNYFDNEAWKRDARMDGRGHSLASYDGAENEQEVEGTTYYLYRIN